MPSIQRYGYLVGQHFAAGHKKTQMCRPTILSWNVGTPQTTTNRKKTIL
jgi:hypothetical protein